MIKIISKVFMLSIMCCSYSYANKCEYVFKNDVSAIRVEVPRRSVYDISAKLTFIKLTEIAVQSIGPVSYKAEIIDDKIRIATTPVPRLRRNGRHRELWPMANDRGNLQPVFREVPGAISIAASIDMPGTFVVGKLDGTIQLISFMHTNRAVQNSRTGLLTYTFVKWMEKHSPSFSKNREQLKISTLDVVTENKSLDYNHNLLANQNAGKLSDNSIVSILMGNHGAIVYKTNSGAIYYKDAVSGAISEATLIYTDSLVRETSDSSFLREILNYKLSDPRLIPL